MPHVKFETTYRNILYFLESNSNLPASDRQIKSCPKRSKIITAEMIELFEKKRTCKREEYNSTYSFNELSSKITSQAKEALKENPNSELVVNVNFDRKSVENYYNEYVEAKHDFDFANKPIEEGEEILLGDDGVEIVKTSNIESSILGELSQTEQDLFSKLGNSNNEQLILMIVKMYSRVTHLETDNINLRRSYVELEESHKTLGRALLVYEDELEDEPVTPSEEAYHKFIELIKQSSPKVKLLFVTLDTSLLTRHRLAEGKPLGIKINKALNMLDLDDTQINILRQANDKKIQLTESLCKDRFNGSSLKKINSYVEAYHTLESIKTSNSDLYDSYKAFRLMNAKQC